MRATPFPSVLPRFEALFVLAVAFLLQTAMCPTHANESRASNQAAKPTAHSTAGGAEFLLAVHPVVAKLGQPRTVFVYQPMELCPGTAFSLDTSLMKTQALVLLRRGPRFGPTAVVCPAVPTPFRAANFEFEFTPSDPGLLTVRVDPAGPEITIQTLPLDYLLAAHPFVGKVGQPRTVFLHHPRPNCPPYGVSLDTSAMEASNLVVLRRIFTPVPCPSVGNPAELARFEFVVTPTKVGLLTIRDEVSVNPRIRGGEITIQTLPTALPSKFDTNGMWFDTATNGSGIALHHRRGTTDEAFGTWFLYSNDGTSRWYSLQSTNWQQDGSVLEGLLFQTRGGCGIANLAGCPAVGSFRSDAPPNLFWLTPPLARITFQSPTRARAEVLTLGGAVLFTSELTKLQF